jgi:RHS repeat-associated protein
LIGISGPAVSASFVYDALGRRVSKTINGVRTEYQYDRQDIASEIRGGAVGVSYLRSLNIDEPFVRQSRTGDEYYLTDALGSVIALTDGTAAVTTTYSYDPFGNTTITGTSDNPFQYTGRENDNTGLYHYRARYYSPTMQRFISEDPISFAGGNINLYVYVENNPLRFTDLLGLAVGDWWDLPANIERSQQIAAEELDNRPNSHNDIGDAERHAEWMRRTTEETNSFTAWISGTGHELEGLFEGQPFNEMLMDLHNNSVGREAGRDKTPIDPNNLVTLPLKEPSKYDPYCMACDDDDEGDGDMGGRK